MTAGGIAASNNTDHDGMEEFLAYIRNPRNGFTAAIFTGGERGIALITGELAAATKEIGKNVAGVEGDVSNLGDLDRLFAQIEREKGKLDIVFANAGMAKYAPIGTITEEFYDSIFDINVKGLLFTVQRALGEKV